MIKRYIEVEPLIELIDDYIQEYDTLEDGYHNPKWCAMQEARWSIEKQPTADVIEVCRCEHCSKSAEHPNGRWCKLLQTVTQNSDYCSWGTKK